MRYLRLLAAALLAALLAAPVSAATDPSAAAQRGLRWLTARQQADGGFPGFGPGATADAVFALVAAGVSPASVTKGGKSPLDFMRANAPKFSAESVAATGKLALAVVAAGEDPRAFAGSDLVAQIEGAQSAQGAYGLTPTDHAFALLALRAAGRTVPASAIRAAGTLQRADGGWSFDGGADTISDSNTTALMVQGLVAAGARGETLSKAVAYLKAQQRPDGGFTYSVESPYGTDTDANSTALTIQALVAAGVELGSLKQGDPVAALLALQNSGGAFRYQAALPDDNDLATAQAVPALLLRPLPLRPAASAAPTAPAALPTTGGDLGLPWAALAGLAALAGAAALRRAAPRAPRA